MLPLFTSVRASTWKQNAIKFFQNLLSLSRVLSQRCLQAEPCWLPRGLCSVAPKGYLFLLLLLNEVSEASAALSLKNPLAARP